ncbi:hypothetical protein F5882DRAFT_300882 [Hyaloscypha sp. PMI_1271]|nr:hypothetical protein F5882DRAFT_300882 [Hyaloscypha sp. PMI_1271]
MDFDLPNAKRVRRSELFSHSQSSAPEPEAADPTSTTLLQARLAALYGPLDILPAPLAPSNPVNPAPKHKATASTHARNGDEEEHAFEFRLFSGPSASGPRTQKIVLVDDEASGLGEGGFIRRERDRAFYIAEKAEGEARTRFQFAALSGDDVLQGMKRRNWGLEVPWRVRVLQGTSTLTLGQKAEVRSTVTAQSADAVSEGRKKPGKKRRVILRERRRKIEAREKAKRKEREGKEEAEREKRTRRNREKKVKRKMKEKALKACNPEASASASVPVDDQSGSE